MRWKRIALAWFTVPTTALIVVLPLLLHGCSCGHDFDFHLVSWFEAAAQFRTGSLHPAWAFSPAWNAGEPRFVFYPPLSWTLGGLLGMLVPWVVVPVAYTWIALTAAGAAMYRLAREFAGTQAAVVAAALYVANPYMVFTAYERTAYAELLATAWIPLLLAAVLRERITVLSVAVPVALLWLTNAPAAVMGCYALGLLAAERVLRLSASAVRREGKRFPALKACAGMAWRLAAGVALGLGLAAFYVVPAAYERRWVQISMATLQGMNVRDNFLFQKIGDGPHDEVLHTASAIAVTMLTAAVVVLIAGAVRVQQQTRLVGSLAMLAAVIAFMLTPLSAAVWRLAPEMSFLQFPWRLVAVLAAVVGLAAALALAQLSTRPPLLILFSLLLVAVLALPLASHFRQGCDDEDTVAARVAVFNARAGSEPTDEYTPTDADNDSLAQTEPSFWLSKDGTQDAAPPAQQSAPVPQHFSVQAPEPGALVLHLREYPAWQVSMNGEVVSRRVHRADGLIAVPLHAGLSHVDVSYIHMPDERIGAAISLASMLGGAALAAASRRRQSRSRIIES